MIIIIKCLYFNLVRDNGKGKGKHEGYAIVYNLLS